MKKTSIMQIIAVAIMIATAGCQLIKGDPNRPGYQEGRTAAFFYVATEPAQPEEVNAAIKTAYNVLKAAFLEGGQSPATIFVKAEIEDLYPDPEYNQEFRDFIFNFYEMAQTRLINEIDLHPDIPTSEVVKNFLKGVEDSLKDWKPGHVENS